AGHAVAVAWIAEGCGRESAIAGEVAGGPGECADSPCRSESLLGADLRPAAHGDARRLRHPRQGADASGTARLAGARVFLPSPPGRGAGGEGRPDVGREEVTQADRDVGRVSAGLRG